MTRRFLRRSKFYGAYLVVWALGPSACSSNLEVFAEPAMGGSAGTSGGASGASGSGGTANGGSGGSADGGSGGSAPASIVVDDFEDGDTRGLSEFGWWYTQNDTTGTQTFAILPVTDREGSSFAARSQGEGFGVWGAIVGFDFTLEEGTYDGGAFSELSFFVKAGPLHEGALSVQVLDGTSAHFIEEIAITPMWQQYRIVFSELERADGAAEPALDTSTLAALQIFVLSEAPFDFWIDDVVLLTP